MKCIIFGVILWLELLGRENINNNKWLKFKLCMDTVAEN